MTENNVSQVSQAFSPEGALAKAIKGFSPRQAQTDMALDVAHAIDKQSSLIVEAGTGTGKTFAYLIPAFLSLNPKNPKKIVVSTGTKNLQEQLFHKDIPLIKKALASNAQVALLKGRANYLCNYRLAQYQDSRGQLDAQMLQDLVKVKTWANGTQSGDIGELVNVSEDSSIFPFVTSTLDNCLARDCPDYEACHLVRARQKASDADIIVVNHHLFFADMALKDTGFGELIPKAQVMIFDEAHQIGDIASEYFGEAFSSKQLVDLCTDVLQVHRSSLTDVKQLGLAAEKLQKTCQEFRLLFNYDPERGNWREKYKQVQFQQKFANLKIDLDFLYQVIKLCVSRNEAIDNCFDRAVNLLAQYDVMANVEAYGMSFWYETTPRSVVLHQTPLNVSEKFNTFVKESGAGWIFTSATLAVDNSFNHFAKHLGLQDAKQLLLDSPFDYQAQSQLVVPRYLPQANDKNRALKLAELAEPLIKASKGACFMLFTSYRVMHQVAEVLAESIDNPLLVQGKMAKRKLLEQFVEQDDAVLLATASFWEGIDVRGDKLTCVIIDKLPFASPDDPLLQARCEDVRRQGGEPFSQIQLPQAVIALKQGVGRLIRDVSDRGVLVICDDRLVNKPYGETFLKSLPDMKRSRDINKAAKFLETLS
ncbi:MULTISPECIES: ATP-dependent DNA helicase [Colwellia]|uniref:ATP-dependent DNA helicase YoaA n=1 Tax=Colwellia psychrerythraea (strain 34H / ATCC BAA-681) TaxID=167879 RepID=Q47XC2_COLP3|nr:MULTISPECIES: helicase C-terminal domain-containing protein [Colwellia]AAZ26082.1 ATP-dependent helicase [Colwellia psychrerythraea 34H]PKH86517.1 ATP-dependent DNA helicase [Colwellia sp. Bg11-28]